MTITMDELLAEFQRLEAQQPKAEGWSREELQQAWGTSSL